uniref:Uncharacterized protein n=1 Tax=Thermogemmatispora argillosa TaxID=2045280 RepID=A0A455SUF1_9CHLR|nr:hypothetical protein KTA_02520 [Thermogemmatispora argillosa]
MTLPWSEYDPVPSPITLSNLLTSLLSLLTKEECVRLYGRLSLTLSIKAWPMTPESVTREACLKQAVPILLAYGFEQGWGTALAAVDELRRHHPVTKSMLLEQDRQALIRSWDHRIERVLQALEHEEAAQPVHQQDPVQPPEGATDQ